MATKVAMPKLGMAMKQGTLLQWLKSEGDRVEQGDLIAEIESEKITTQVEAPASGILHPVAEEGQALPVGGLIAWITAPGESVPVAEETGPAEVEVVEQPVGTAKAAAPPGEKKEFVPASPIARRMAREHGIDLAQVEGTGPQGRVTREDVDRAIQAAEAAPARGVPFAGMRRTIARRMTGSLQTMAQVTLCTEVDVTELVRLREHLRRDFDLTYTDLIIQAAARALEKHPRLNASLEDDEIRLHDQIHIGMAVALEEGLIVPVIRNANRKTLREIAGETKDLAQRAREGTLSIDEATGSTFSVTNLGGYGIDGFTPIINPPEVAILGVGRIVEKPAAYRGAVALRQMMVLSLTFDHRIVDGAPAAEFLHTVAEMLEIPYLLSAG
ncbi:MAG: dihydrolipoamide acetyltransferase family protein [Anaerolineae bacterium]